MTTPIRRLVSGFKSFRAEYYEQRPERIRHLASEGQNPQVLVIGCSDSRVDPALLMNAEPGELFVVRNVANLVPPCENDGGYHGTSAVLQFAVQELGVGDIVVLGHASCGGIHALVEQAAGVPKPREFIAPWMALAGRHCADLLDDRDGKAVDRAACEQAAIKGSLGNLMTFPFIRERIDARTLAIHGWWFELEKGRLWRYDDGTGAFRRFA